MQEISLEQLKKLLPGKLQESSNKVVDGVSFKDLCDEYRKIQICSVNIKHAYDTFVSKILSKYEPIKFVGDGSSRSAFACVGGKCIKVAKSQAGVAQNKQENKNTAEHWWRRNYNCFTKTYEHSDDYALLLSECCSHIDSEQHLAEALGMDDESMLTAVIWAVVEEKSHDVKKSATSLRAKCTTWRKSGGSINGIQLSDKSIETAEHATEWLESLSDRQSLTPGKKSFLQIANFWKKHGIEELLPGDVGSYRNWGYAIRDGELTPVMLDVGFSQKVADIFYEDNHMNNESKLINYWAHMLDESADTATRHGYVDEGYFRYVYPAEGFDYATVSDFSTAVENMFPGQNCANFGPEGKIFGRVNGVKENGDAALFTIAPYKNGLRRCDCSTNPGAPELNAEELKAELGKLDPNAKITVEYSDPTGFGPSKKTFAAPIKNISISKTDGLYLRPDFEKQEVTGTAQDAMVDFMKRRAGNLEEARHSMRGPAAARRDGGIDEIADMRQKLANGVVEFTFWKHGEEGQGDVQRHAVGTTSENVVPVAERRRLDPNYDENVASYERRANFIIWFWDLEKNAVRCFNTNRFDEILNYEPTDRRAAPNIERVGNIFIHRDVDDGANRPLDDARIDEINGRFDDMMQNDDDELVQALHGTADGLGVRGMYVDRTADGAPTLRIEISKRGTDQDPPYQLRINELRSLIRDRFGVDVKTVTVDGTFRY